MRTSLMVSLALALVACKGESKKSNEGSGTASASAKAALDAAAATPTPTIDAAPAATTDDTLKKPFFYAVTKDGKTSHLLGSIHIGVEARRLPKVVWDAGAKAKSFAMEADISDLFAMAEKIRRTDGGSLEKDLGPEYYKKLDDAIGKTTPLKLLDGMKPLVVLGQLEQLGMAPGFALDQAIDLAFLEAAKKAGQEIHYLEAATVQIEILDKWFDIAYLKHQLDHLDGIKAEHEKLFASYVAGDESSMQMEEASSKDEWIALGRKPEDYDRMMEELLYGRNAAWIPKIEELLAKGDAFIVVGAAHLVGDRSVVDLLQKAGYTVERVTP